MDCSKLFFLSLLLISCNAAAPVEPKPKVSVSGTVFCNHKCSRDNNEQLSLVPLPGAEVKLRCQNSTLVSTSDQNGLFKFTGRLSSDCKAVLVRSPSRNCMAATNLNGGLAGAKLVNTAEALGMSALLSHLKEEYHVGPFVFSNCSESHVVDQFVWEPKYQVAGQATPPPSSPNQMSPPPRTATPPPPSRAAATPPPPAKSQSPPPAKSQSPPPAKSSPPASPPQSAVPPPPSNASPPKSPAN